MRGRSMCLFSCKKQFISVLLPVLVFCGFAEPSFGNADDKTVETVASKSIAVVGLDCEESEVWVAQDPFNDFLTQQVVGPMNVSSNIMIFTRLTAPTLVALQVYKGLKGYGIDAGQKIPESHKGRWDEILKKYCDMARSVYDNGVKKVSEKALEMSYSGESEYAINEYIKQSLSYFAREWGKACCRKLVKSGAIKELKNIYLIAKYPEKANKTVKVAKSSAKPSAPSKVAKSSAKSSAPRKVAKSPSPAQTTGKVASSSVTDQGTSNVVQSSTVSDVSADNGSSAPTMSADEVKKILLSLDKSGELDRALESRMQGELDSYGISVHDIPDDVSKECCDKAEPILKSGLNDMFCKACDMANNGASVQEINTYVHDATLEVVNTYGSACVRELVKSGALDELKAH